MPGDFWSRKDGCFEVVCTCPSVNLIVIGSGTAPVPFNVVSKSKLKASTRTVPYILLQGKEAFVKKSHTTKVTGDEKGVKKGIVSGTLSEKAEPITFDPTVKGDGSPMIRSAELFFMQGKNTMGKMTTTLGGNGGSVNANGGILGPCTPPDMGGVQGSDAWDKALAMLSDPKGTYAKLQGMKSKYDTVSGMINGDIPFSAAGMAGTLGGLAGGLGETLANPSLLNAAGTLSQAGDYINKAQTAKGMLTGEIPFSPSAALSLAGGVTGNSAMSRAASILGPIEQYNSRGSSPRGSRGGATPKPTLQQNSGKATKHGSTIKQMRTPGFVASPPSLDSLSPYATVGKSIIGAMESSHNPTASAMMSGLGSLMGSPLLLATAQSIHQYQFPTLAGAMPIAFGITYLSDMFYNGGFSIDR